MILKIKNDISEIRYLCESIAEFCSKKDLPSSLCHDLLMIFDEMVTNVISYGYPEGGEHIIEISLKKQAHEIILNIKDDGVEFDPVGKDDPDTELSIEDRLIGGLGIFLVKNLSKSVVYKRAQGFNLLTVIVDLDSHMKKSNLNCES